MRWLVALAVLAVPARCQLLVFSSDLSGHYVPVNETSGVDCPLVVDPSALLLPETMELDGTEDVMQLEDEESEEKETSSRWGDCGVGGIPRLASQLKTVRNQTVTAVTAGNILSNGDWELPVNFTAAVQAASLFDVMGLGPGEFRRGVPFLVEFLQAVNRTSGGNTSVVACNVKSSLIGDLVVPSITLNGVVFIGFVDPAGVEDFLALDSAIQLSNASCVQEEVDKHAKENATVVVVGSASSLNASGILNITGVSAFILSGLPDADKEEALKNSATVLVTQGNGETVGIFNIAKNETNSTALDHHVVDDNVTANFIADLQQTVTDFYATPVTSYYTLTADKCTSLECSVGDVICDAVLIGSLLDGRVTSRPMAVWPGKKLNSTIPKGPMTVGDLYSILPSEPVAVANASGDTVTQLFARAVRDMTVDASASDTFLQVSGVRVTYDLDLPEQYRPKYLMNLCLTCSPQQYLPVTPAWNYTIVLPASMLGDPTWSDITSQFTGVYVTEFSARYAVSAKAQLTGRLLSPVGGRLGFTHIPPDMEPSSDTFVAVLSTIVVCMVVFGLALFGFHVWSRRQSRFGSTTGLLR